MKQLDMFSPAKGSVITFGVSLTIAIILAAGFIYYRNIKNTAAQQASSQLQTVSSERQTLTDDLDFLKKNITAVKRLIKFRLLDEPDRVGWVKQLETIYKSMNLPPTLKTELDLPKKVAPKGSANAGAQSGQPEAPPEALAHDLNIEMSGIHEGEFLNFMDKLNTEWPVLFRVEHCAMSLMSQEERYSVAGDTQDSKPKGLRIKCTLRIFSLPQASDGQAAPAPPPPPMGKRG